MFLNDTAMPDGYSVYGHQVAGHRFETGKQGMLLDSDGKLLKPIQAPPRGEREVEFYQTVFGCETSDQTILRLRQFVPTFYGVKHVVFPDLPLKDNYITLENLTRHFNKPCILDIKIGKCVTDHFATQAKRERALRKYPEQEEFGFRILGMKFFNKTSQQFTFHDKTFGKNLRTRTEILTGLKEFFCQEEHGKRHIEEILENLEAIKIWVLEQRVFRLYSSSILIIYEGDEMLDKNSLEKENSTSNLNVDDNSSDELLNNDSTVREPTNAEMSVLQKDCSWQNDTPSQKPNVSVHLVDFAHTYIGHYEGRDDNYLYGLDNLIHYVQQLVG